MSAAKKQSNYRFTFLAKLACSAPITADFQNAMEEASGASIMLFGQDIHHWLHLSCPLDKPLSRKFFSETHKGNRVLANAGVTATEIPLAQIELTLK